LYFGIRFPLRKRGIEGDLTSRKSFASTGIWTTPAFAQQAALAVFGAFSRAAIILGFGGSVRFGFLGKSRCGGSQRDAKTQADEQESNDF
jgi:hypothetical protein